jgi:hypothetical protein
MFEIVLPLMTMGFAAVPIVAKVLAPVIPPTSRMPLPPIN